MAMTSAERSKKWREKHPERNKRIQHESYMRSRDARLAYQREYDRTH